MGAGGGPSVWVLPFAPRSPPEARTSPAGPPANPTGPAMGHLLLPPHTSRQALETLALTLCTHSPFPGP